MTQGTFLDLLCSLQNQGQKLIKSLDSVCPAVPSVFYDDKAIKIRQANFPTLEQQANTWDICINTYH